MAKPRSGEIRRGVRESNIGNERINGIHNTVSFRSQITDKIFFSDFCGFQMRQHWRMQHQLFEFNIYAGHNRISPAWSTAVSD